jgi:hypothetical protein
MPSIIRVGCRVSGLVGPLQELQNGQRRRTRMRFFGVVVRSVPEQKWTVYWEAIQRVADHGFAVLKFESRPPADGGLVGLNIEQLMNDTMYIRDQQGIDDYLKTWQPPRLPTNNSNSHHDTIPPATTGTDRQGQQHDTIPPTTTGTDQAQQHDTIPPTTTGVDQAQQHDTIPPTTTGTDQAQQHATIPIVETDPDDEYDEEVFDPISIVREFMDETSTDSHLRRQTQYLQEKLALMAEVVKVKTAEWTVRDDVKADEVVPDKDPEQIGICGFDFNETPVKCGNRNSQQRINFLALIIHMWPGDWKSQLQRLNLRIRLENKLKKATTRYGRPKIVKEISEREFWVWWGLILMARLEGRQGNLWDKHESEGMKAKVNLSEFMLEYRFNQIRGYIPFLWASNKRKQDGDPWWKFSEAIDEFNANRARTVKAGFLKVMDELMSAYCPQTLAQGDLPHLSFIQRKPEPLGSEFKVTTSSKPRLSKFLELQKGKAAMKLAEFCDVLKSTTACTKRLVKYTCDTRDQDGSMDNEAQQQYHETWLGDAWFASVATAVAVSEYGHFIGIVKTAHSLYPKKWLEEKMAEWPGGSHLVLFATVDGVELIAVGYKYNKKKVLCFISTKGAGHTEPGQAYEAKWKDSNLNTMFRDIPRPEICSKYFTKSNIVDVNNQSRQYDLALEKHWVTKTGWFRLVTSLFGIGVVDCWNGYTFHIGDNHRHKHIKLLEWVDIAAFDCLHNTFSDVPESERAITIDITDTGTSGGNANGDVIGASAISLQSLAFSECSVISSLADTHSRPQISPREAFLWQHRLHQTEELETHKVCEATGKKRKGMRKKRGKCHQCQMKSSHYCNTCPPPPHGIKRWVCPDSSQRGCQEKHLEEITLESSL